MKNSFFITTAIDYTNEPVHIGHSYQKILADSLARYHRLVGEKTYFLTGTDEHGQKVEKSAHQHNIDPKEYVDKIAAIDKKEWDALDISYDRFIRTTDPDHLKFASDFYLKAKANGDIYLGQYEGLYCEGCEAYLNESDLVDGKCPTHPNRKPFQISEKNYFFKLSKYQKFLEELIENNKQYVIPESKRKEILAFVKRGLKDFAVSRPNLKWGIPVPDDPEQTIYVWFDALINYLTYGIEEKCWPADVHILGKDNQRFHAIFWPAMLKSAGYELPKTILVHDFISLNGQKISKSLGNIITPSELIKQFGVDGVRYYFLRYGPLTNDVDITIDKIKEVYNADLANGLGNLVARVAKLCERSTFEFKSSRPLTLYPFLILSLNEYKVNEALELIWNEIKKADQIVDKEQPWTLEGKKLLKVLQELISRILLIAYNLKPFIPQTAEKIEKQFSNSIIKSESPLFPRQ